MRWHVKTLPALAVLTLLATPLCAETGLPPRDGEDVLILVLLSGEVIQGKVSQLDDRYLVVLPTGRIFVPASNVEAICRNLEEAYYLRRSRIGQGQAQDHAGLAQWCQRQGLDALAEKELQVAKQLDPNHPIVGLVERRLAASRMSLETPDVSLGEESVLEPTPQQLEDFAAGLPAGTVESFTRVVQPFLLNRCSTSGCHTERSPNEFRLERSRPGVPLGRTSTHRNLLATLKLVDAASPDQCELLRPKRCPYRLQTEATLSLSRSGQYRFLVAWVTLLTQQSAGESRAPSVARQTGLPETIRSSPPMVSPLEASSSPPGAGATTDSPLKASFDALSSGGEPSADQKPPVLGQPPSADPFDPAIFNRRFGTAAPPSPEASQGGKVPLPNPFFAR